LRGSPSTLRRDKTFFSGRLIFKENIFFISGDFYCFILPKLFAKTELAADFTATAALSAYIFCKNSGFRLCLPFWHANYIFAR